MPSEARAIGRSLDVYYRDAARTRRMDALNARFVEPGGLAFDVGAHLGDRTASFRRLGARVVALEPQPRIFRALRLIHGRDPAVALLRAAAGAGAGEIVLHVNAANPTVSTASPALIAAARNAPGWEGQVWDGRVTVPLVPLDALVAEHGVPDFVKIDVEGHEADVLRGLSTPPPSLSFEFTTIQRDLVAACVARLGALGTYGYDLSLGEDHALRLGRWVDGAALLSAVSDLPDSANSGDVYARLQPG